MPVAIAVLLLLTPAGAACRTEPLAPTLPAIQQRVFDVHCALGGCHAGPAPESGLNLEAGRAYGQLVDQPSTGMPDLLRVVPGDAAGSYLVRKLEGEGIVGEPMPLGKATLPDSVVAVIRRWIDDGAPRR